MSVRLLLAYLAYIPCYLGILMLILGHFFITFIPGPGPNFWFLYAAIFCTLGYLVPNRRDRILALFWAAASVLRAYLYP